MEEAIREDFHELVEGDALAIWWCNRAGRPGVSVEGFDEPYLRELGEVTIRPNDVMCYSERQFEQRRAWNARGSSFQVVPDPFDETKPIEWSPVWSLTRREHRYLPTSYLYFT